MWRTAPSPSNTWRRWLIRYRAMPVWPTPGLFHWVSPPPQNWRKLSSPEDPWIPCGLVWVWPTWSIRHSQPSSSSQDSSLWRLLSISSLSTNRSSSLSELKLRKLGRTLASDVRTRTTTSPRHFVLSCCQKKMIRKQISLKKKNYLTHYKCFESLACRTK